MASYCPVNKGKDITLNSYLDSPQIKSNESFKDLVNGTLQLPGLTVSSTRGIRAIMLQTQENRSASLSNHKG